MKRNCGVWETRSGFVLAIMLFSVAIPGAGSVLGAGLTSSGALVSLNNVTVPDGMTNLVAVDGCLTHTMALRADGTLIGWAYSIVDQALAAVPPDLGPVLDFAVERGYTLAVKTNGTVAGWGSSLLGSPANLSNVVAVAAGPDFAVALRGDGSLVKWGLGRPIPTPPPNIVAVDAGSDSVIILNSTGEVFTWNAFTIPPASFSQTGWSNITAISLGRRYALALKADGTVPGVPGLTGIVAVAAGGDSYGLAVKQDGTLVNWGGPPLTARLTNVTYISANGNPFAITRWPAVTANPQSVTAQRGETVTLTATVRGEGPFSFQWRKDGTNLPGAIEASLILTNVQQAETGAYTLEVSNLAGAIESLPATVTLFGVPGIVSQPESQTVFTGARVGFMVTATGAEPLGYQWYLNGNPVGGATGSQLVLSSTASVDAGTYTCVVSNEFGQVTSSAATLVLTPTPSWPTSPPGTVVALGGPAVPPGLTNAIAVAAGRSQGLALLADRTVTSWGHAFYEEPMPSGLSNVVAIFAGEGRNLVLRADGTVVAWGSHPSSVPETLYGVVAIAAGINQNAALKSDGKLVTWGSGLAPSASATNIVAIDAGWDEGLALRQNGTALTWGVFSSGEIGSSNITAVSMGSHYILLLKGDGTVEGGGVPQGLSNVVAIAAGAKSYGLALKTDGTVASWGGPPVPEGLTGVSAIAAGSFGLLISTNPPQPLLAASANTDGSVSLFSPVSVSGFVLEEAMNVLMPPTEVPGYTNSFIFAEEENPGFRIPVTNGLRFYRLRKQ